MGADLEVWTAEKLKVIKDQIAPKATDAELEYFAAVCRRTGLDPAARQIYCLHRNTYNPDTKRKEPKMSIQVSIDGLRVIAERAGDYEGTSKAEWCGTDGKWVDIWLDSKPPAAARIGVWRRNFREALVRTALWTEYRQGFANDDGSFKLTGQWASMPALMLAKCAEALALRAAFPNDMSGLYTADEMAQADNDAPKPRTRTYEEVPTGHTTGSDRARIQAEIGPPANVDAETGEILTSQETAKPEPRRTFAAPGRSTSAENTERIMAAFTEADETLANRPEISDLKKRIAALDGFAKDSLADAWKAAGLPSVAAANAKLTKDQLVEATALVDAAEQAVADEVAAS